MACSRRYLIILSYLILSYLKVVRNRAEILMFMGRQILGEGTPKFLTQFVYKLQSPSNMILV